MQVQGLPRLIAGKASWIGPQPVTHGLRFFDKV